jgi:hypothetical protein
LWMPRSLIKDTWNDGESGPRCLNICIPTRVKIWELWKQRSLLCLDLKTRILLTLPFQVNARSTREQVILLLPPLRAPSPAQFQVSLVWASSVTWGRAASQQVSILFTGLLSPSHFFLLLTLWAQSEVSCLLQPRQT